MVKERIYANSAIVTEPFGCGSDDIRVSISLNEGSWDTWLLGEPVDASDVLRASQ